MAIIKSIIGKHTCFSRLSRDKVTVSRSNDIKISLLLVLLPFLNVPVYGRVYSSD